MTKQCVPSEVDAEAEETVEHRPYYKTQFVLSEVDAEVDETVEHRPYYKTQFILSEVDAEAEKTLAQRDYNTRIRHQMADIRQMRVRAKE